MDTWRATRSGRGRSRKRNRSVGTLNEACLPKQPMDIFRQTTLHRTDTLCSREGEVRDRPDNHSSGKHLTSSLERSRTFSHSSYPHHKVILERDRGASVLCCRHISVGLHFGLLEQRVVRPQSFFLFLQKYVQHHRHPKHHRAKLRGFRGQGKVRGEVSRYIG